MKIQPIVFRWIDVDVVDADGIVNRQKAMVPLQRYGNVCARQYRDGEDYTLVPLEGRNMASHNAFFAAIHDGFMNLPDNIAARWPSAEHLRKWLLCETGWFDEKEFDCPDEEFAKRLAIFVRASDEYARISIHRPPPNWKVIVRRAKSQGLNAMGKEDFERSKKDCLDLLEAMTSVPRGTLMREAGRSA